MLKESIAIARHGLVSGHVGDGINGFAHATPDAMPPSEGSRVGRHAIAAVAGPWAP